MNLSPYTKYFLWKRKCWPHKTFLLFTHILVLIDTVHLHWTFSLSKNNKTRFAPGLMPFLQHHRKMKSIQKNTIVFFFFSIWNLYCWISNYIWNKFKVCKIIPVEAMEWENLHRSRSRKYKSWFVISHHGKEEDELTSISNLFSWYIPKYSEDYDFKYYRARGSKYWT